MITIQNGKLTIPDNDRFVGFAGDNTVNTKQFLLLNRVKEGCTYTLCLRFDDESVCSVPLNAEVEGTDTVLTWQIRGEQLYRTGIVTAQLKTVDSDGSIAHSTKDFFIVGSSVEFGDDGTEIEYVTPSQLRNSINQALQSVCATAPYIGDDGYWYIYNPDAGSYIRTEYHIGNQKVDNAMSGSSESPVGNRYIKQYVEDKVNELRSNLIRTDVIPNVTPGTVGTIGIGPNREIFFCTEDNRWEPLITNVFLRDKMNLIEEVEDIRYADDGNLFLNDGILYMKYNGNAVTLVTGNDVYSKSEIDTMIGNVETLLAQI